MNLPNWLTVGRIALVPVFLMLAYQDTAAGYLGALGVFVVASATDQLDGHLARKHGAVTRLGQFLDPTADKLLIGAALLVLVTARAFPLWAALVIALREVAVQILRTRIVSAGGDLPASAAGKLKTGTQIALVAWWLLPWEPNPGHWLLLVATLAITLYSGYVYFRNARASAGARA